MDLYAENHAMMVRQAAGMIVSMVSVVVSTLKRVRDEPETKPDLDPNLSCMTLEVMLSSIDREPCRPSTIP